ncbi:MAG: tRNA 2-selenouridine(34) synthase MnmH [Spirochaetota bacterium]
MEAGFDDLFAEERPVVIDVRSPAEFADGSVPGSFNVPLFSNEERAIVGTLYAHDGVDAAWDEGIRLVSPKIPGIVDAVRGHRGTDTRAVIVLCWRGGMRSKAAVNFLALARIPAVQYTGGYKSYRRSIRDVIARIADDFSTITVRGLTGTGKTAIMRRALADGAAFLDLEHYAAHRGSAFGGAGLTQPTQQNFEHVLGEALVRFRYHGDRTLFIEGESRRIGRITVPEVVIDRIIKSDHIEITAPMDVRVQNILDEYMPFITADLVVATLEKIRDALGGERYTAYVSLAREERYAELIRLLMENYYDTGYTFFWNKYGGGRCLLQVPHDAAFDLVRALRTREQA